MTITVEQILKLAEVVKHHISNRCFGHDHVITLVTEDDKVVKVAFCEEDIEEETCLGDECNPW